MATFTSQPLDGNARSSLGGILPGTGYVVPRIGQGIAVDSVTGATVGSLESAPVDGQRATYVYTAFGITPYATPTDWILLQGSASKTVKVTRVDIRYYATAVAYVEFHLVKRTAANTGGTSTSQAAFVAKYDSADPAQTGVILLYTVVPGALGAGVDVFTGRLLAQSLTTAAGSQQTDPVSYPRDAAALVAKTLTLNGVAEFCAINFNSGAVPAGTKIDVLVEWEEF